MNRRTFITFSSLATFFASYPSKLFGYVIQELPDEQICQKKFELAVSQNLFDKPINEVIVEIGKSFIGTEYVANALDVDGEERLMINLRGLDCVTFYENCVVLARCIKMKKTTFDDYKAQLQFLRYRNGKIDGYTSRLHYTTDYWYEAEKKGILNVITKEIFGEKNVKKIPKPINFMSTHRTSYKQLATDDANLAKIQAQEDAMNKRTEYYLPKEKLHLFADKVNHGDLIGIATNIPGLDISHTGIAVRMENGALHYMHAPNVGYKVQITDVPLHDYLAKNKKQTGIIVGKMNEPPLSPSKEGK